MAVRLSLLLWLLPLIHGQQQTFSLLPGFGQMQLPQFPGTLGLPTQSQPAPVYPQPAQSAPTFSGLQQPSFSTFSQPPVVQPAQQPLGVQPTGQFNSLFPFSFPTFQLPTHSFAPFPGVVTVSPLYGLGQAQAPFQISQPQNQGQISQQIAPQSQGQPQVPQAPPAPAANTPAPTVIVTPSAPVPPPKPKVESTVQIHPPPAPSTPRPSEITTSLPIIDARSNPKPEKKLTTAKTPLEELEEEEEQDDNTPPEIPKELLAIREQLHEDEVEETAQVEQKKPEERKSLLKAGSVAPKVLDFRSINQAKPAPATTKANEMTEEEIEEQKEVDEILSKVLDAVLPMHGQVAAANSEIEFRS